MLVCFGCGRRDSKWGFYVNTYNIFHRVERHRALARRFLAVHPAPSKLFPGLLGGGRGMVYLGVGARLRLAPISANHLHPAQHCGLSDVATGGTVEEGTGATGESGAPVTSAHTPDHANRSEKESLERRGKFSHERTQNTNLHPQ